MGKKLSLATLRALLGKTADEVKETLAAAGKVKYSSDHIVAKEAGFEIALDRPPGAKKKVLHTLFLYPAFGEAPKGFAFTTRKALLASLPAPHRTWVIGKGKVDVTSEGVSHDTWTIDGYDVSASYDKAGAVRDLLVSTSQAATGSSLSTLPLHFETKPADAVDDASLTGMALLVAWAADRHGLPAKHAATEKGKAFAARKLTPRRFLIEACGKTLSTLDVAPAVGEFLSTYTHNTYCDDDGAREATYAPIQKLLRLPRPDEARYTDDYLGTFSDLESSAHVPDSWDAVDRIAPVIDARFADFAETGFQKAPKNLKAYEKAAKLRDAVKVTPEKKALAKTVIDDALAEELVALIGKSLKDKAVKEILTRAGLPIGKKIDEQANPAAGIAYMGTNFDIDGKKALGVDYVAFYGAKQTKYVRGIGAEVEFQAYEGALPKGLKIGQRRAAVAKQLGKPSKSGDDHDTWEPSPTRRINARFADDKLVMLRFGRPLDY
jgi:hypothetical protein